MECHSELVIRPCALKQLNQDTDIIILPANKDSTYEKLKKDPTASLKTLTTNFIKKNNLPDMSIPRNAVPLRLYGLPKIHKNNIPLRPIVSAINSPTYDLACFLVSILESLTGAAMGSPISLIIANIFMEHFESQAIKKSHKHGTETEQHGKLPFVDVLVTRKPDGSLGHQIYRKSTHTNRYLHAASHHHPAQKQAVINSLIYRAFTICDKDSIQNELKKLKNTLQINGYTLQQINEVIKKHQNKPSTTTQKTPAPEQTTNLKKGTTYLPYIKSVTDKIGRILNKHNIQTVYKPTNKIGQILNNPKDKRPLLDTPGVYKIPCSYGKVY
ncbi:uncharacterized protein LOC109863122, partial [Pseudomyrmex gracilis]|uniref:uncharacterized protein LOC109863122 n=1 Tax=Pseudomyrmex gracilis TaxID=219809 RepID=UPI000995D71B